MGDLCKNGLHAKTPENRRRTSVGTTCAPCSRARDRERHARDRVKRNALSTARYHTIDKPHRRARNLAQRGLTLDDYDAMLAAQGGCCAICKTITPGGVWNTHFMVDHDHKTNLVRGLLCGNCNIALGNMQDDPARLRAAAKYLEDRAVERAG